MNKMILAVIALLISVTPLSLSAAGKPLFTSHSSADKPSSRRWFDSSVFLPLFPPEMPGAVATGKNEFPPEKSASSTPRLRIEAALRQLDKLKSYRAKIILSGVPGTADDVSSADVVNPDRIHSRSGDVEMIEIGNQMWIREAGRDWELRVREANIRPWQALIPLVDKLENLVVTENDVLLEKKSATVYEFSGTPHGAPVQAGKFTATLRIWIAKGDGNPLMIESENSISPVKLKMWFTDFNTSIRIDAPVSSSED